MKKNVYPIETEVTVGDGIEAKIVGIAIYTTHVEYQICWWKNDERKKIWVNESELTVNNSRKKPIGFTTENIE